MNPATEPSTDRPRRKAGSNARSGVLTGLALIAASLGCSHLAADTVTVPVPLQYGLVRQALYEQVFTDPGGSATLYSDFSGCNRLILSDPEPGGADGRLRLRTVVRARAGTPIAGECRFARDWSGIVELHHQVEVEAGGTAVGFRVVDSRLLSADDGKSVLPRFVRRGIREHVHPRLDSVRIDLQPVRDGIREVLEAVDAGSPVPEDPNIPPAPGVSDVRLSGVRAEAEHLVLELAFAVTDPPPQPWAPTEQAPLGPSELAAWDEAWQAWDGFATWLIKSLAVTAETRGQTELVDHLAEILLEARHELRDALARETRAPDPVRELFLSTWSRLAPVAGDLQVSLPGSQALPFAAFISAGDALVALDTLAPHLGFRLDRHALRAFARVLAPGVSDYELRYDFAVDPELRALLGLDPELPAAFAADVSGAPVHRALRWLAALVPSAHANAIDPQLLQRLNRWTPRRRDVDMYLQSMERLLSAIAEAERDRGKVADPYLDLYDALLRATAWQESCWRQYVEGEAGLEPIRSSAGSVGLMQVNMHVWRGVYDVALLLGDVGYNARAGNEILVHYLVDHAIRKGEHRHEGGTDNLPRAAYAAYNGGPRHLTRYRDPDTSATLRSIDAAFWNKFETIQELGPPAVKRCLGG